MRAGALVLVPGPLDPADWWSQRRLALPDFEVAAPQPETAGSPYAIGWIAAVAQALRSSALHGPVVFVAHGTAGPLLPALARAQRVAGRQTAGYVFVDATLPRPGSPSHLDLLRAADDDAASAAHDALHQPGAAWPPEAARPRDHGFWTEKLPPAPDWPDAPCGYVHTGAEVAGVGPTDFWARSARARGWVVQEGSDLGPVLAAMLAALPG